jgi:hypothetical protein
MRYGLKREDYDELMILGPEGIKLPPRQRAEIVAKEYPKSTPKAAMELRSRGLDADPASLDYLIKRGMIPAPGGEGRNREWLPKHVDAAAAYLDEQQRYVPGTVARMFFNIDPADDVRAQQEAFAANPDLPPDPSYFVMEILPGAPGVGVYSKVRYRRMAKAEEADWRKRIEAAKKAEGGNKR